ncbi:MAG: putative quinol monooxygenase [Dehalococcoidia bacterium]
MGKFGLYNKFTARAGQRDQLVEQLLSAARLVEQAPGCELYIVNISPNDAATVWVTEVWTSEDHHRDSLSLAGVPALIAETMPLLAGPPEQIKLVPVGGKGLTT